MDRIVEMVRKNRTEALMTFLGKNEESMLAARSIRGFGLVDRGTGQ